MSSNHSAVIILAAGKGSRMKSDLPKVMHLLDGKPLITHVVDAVESATCFDLPVVVVSKEHTLVQEELRDRARYVVQAEQLGTGHAAAQAKPLLEGAAEHIVVLYGDMPFVSSHSLKRLLDRHKERRNALTVMTVTVPNFEGEYASYYGFSRIIRRSSDGHIAKDVQMKDCTAEELLVKELNTCYFCFDAAWFWNHITKLNTNNVQKEYYLTDLLQIAIDGGDRVSSIDVDPKEARGVNTKEDLDLAHIAVRTIK